MTTPAPVTDDRLAELREHSRINADQTPHMAAKRHRDIETALSELQQLRRLLYEHYDDCTGTGCDTCIGYADLYPERPVGCPPA